MKKQREYNAGNYIFVALITAIFVLSVVCILNACTPATTLSKSVVNNFMNNVMILEVTTASGDIAKGTGVFIDTDEVVSVAHLFEDEYQKIEAFSYDRSMRFELELVKIDADKDLAKLKSKTRGAVKTVNFATKYQINYGDAIAKIGNALGYGLSVDEGIVANPYVKIESDGVEKEVVQISIDIKNGDSGAPVFGADGRLIGIISFKTNTGLIGGDGASFVIPAYIVADFCAA